MNDAAPDTGLTLLRASRLEALLGPLLSLLESTRPANLLEPQTVIAAHPGMKQWLALALAEKVGADRIVANLDVILPSRWIDGLSRRLLGEAAVALPRYRREHLRWTLHRLLAEPARRGVTDPRVVDYLEKSSGEDERALRHFQLADRLARVFSQYLVYRSDWLQAWEAGQSHFAAAKFPDATLQTLEAQCLAPLWKAAVAALGEHRGEHRGGLVGKLVATLEGAAFELPPLHVFGLSHLPPAELAVLRAYARLAPVFLYLPDPCREYWGGLYAGLQGEDGANRPDLAQWQAFRDSESNRLKDPSALDWREQGHPLLARWGRMGQHFFASLVDDQLREDIRHHADTADTAPENRLQRVQESIRRLQPGLMREDTNGSVATDASLRVHACHTRQRELEVLRDALLDAIGNDGVRAGGIVVMAPDIQHYLPLIPAVFGEPGSARERRLPYHLADLPQARSHPLFTLFETLLEVGASRLTAAEVVDLLGAAELRRALSLDADAVDTLTEWLVHSRVAWALDGAHKQALSLPPRPEFSFAWAVDRMLSGYLMGESSASAQPDFIELPDGTGLLPLTGIDGPGAAALGGLDRLLRELQAWRALADGEHPSSVWAGKLRERVDALMRIDPTDADAHSALSVIHRAIERLASDPARNGQDPALRLCVVRDVLRDALALASERQRFLMGGITFCGMVPQRAIPFDVVCVLGLNEGAFPRTPSDGGVDLMAHIRRVGDRDVAGDDRYLFLETLMSARKRLHLSFIGQGVRDGKHRNPAAPLSELLGELDRGADVAPDANENDQPRPWLVRHPLQPFDGRYFDGSHPALFSYSDAFASMHGEGSLPLPSLRDGDLPDTEPLPEPLPLSELEGFFKDPAKALLKSRLQLSLDALDENERLPEAEPMEDISRIHTVARRVFFETVLPASCADPLWRWDGSPPAWVSQGGLLPLGEAGQLAWREQAEAVDALSGMARASARFVRCGVGQAVRIDIAFSVDDRSTAAARSRGRLTGIVRNVFPLAGSDGASHGEQIVFAFPDPGNEKHRLKKSGDLGFKDRVPAFLHWALLRLQRADAGDPAPVRLTVLAEGEPGFVDKVNAWDASYCASNAQARAGMDADLRRRIGILVELWRLGRAGLSRFYPKSGWAALHAYEKQKGKDLADGTDKAPEAMGNAARNAWQGGFGSTGERDYAPGYARLLEGDFVFGDRTMDPDGKALGMLFEDARLLNELMLMDAMDERVEDAA